MSNPATKLAELLREWSVSKHHRPEQARDIGGGKDREWATQVRAVGYVQEIARLLDGMDASGSRVDPYRAAWPSWAAAVFSYYAPWRSIDKQRDRPAIPESDLNLLDALAGYLDDIDLAPEPTVHQRNELHDSIEGARRLIADDPELPKHVKQYLFSLVAEVEHCLDEFETFGSVALRGISLQLGAALQVAATQVKDDGRRKRYVDIAKAVMLQASGGALLELTKYTFQLLSGG